PTRAGSTTQAADGIRDDLVTGAPTSALPTVGQAGSTTAVSSSQNPSVFGQSVTFTATVSPVAPGAGTRTGTVTFYDGVTSLGTEIGRASGRERVSTAALAGRLEGMTTATEGG